MEPTSTGVQKWLNTIATYDGDFKKWEASYPEDHQALPGRQPQLGNQRNRKV
jgi:hypothetical protein